MSDSWSEEIGGTKVNFVEANISVEGYPPDALACEFYDGETWRRYAVRTGNPAAYDRQEMRDALGHWLARNGVLAQ